MKLYFDKRSKDPTYYVQQGIRNGKKTTTRNIKNLGKHSELLKITDDPESYARQQILLMNEEARTGKISFNLTADFESDKKVSSGRVNNNILVGTTENSRLGKKTQKTANYQKQNGSTWPLLKFKR